MSQSINALWVLMQIVLQRAAFVAIFAGALGLVGYAVACAFGAMPWLSMPLQFGEYTFADAGMWVQLGLTGLAAALCFFLPSNARIMSLETSHRAFHVTMQDVTRAYATAHAADRAGLFRMKSEFDSVRERMAFLRDHPDLTELEPSVLEIASQMSHISRELAGVYSDARVARARDFLIQRQQEIEIFNERIEDAKAVATEMRGWLARVEIDESVAQSQLCRLVDELAEILPELDMPVALGDAEDDNRVVSITKAAAE